MAALFNGLRKFSGPTTGSHSFAVRTTNRLPHIVFDSAFWNRESFNSVVTNNII